MALLKEKNTEYTNEIVQLVLSSLSQFSGVTTKKMFGGSGFMYAGKMFGLVDSKENCFLRADEDTIEIFTKLDGEQHSRMAYYSISEQNIKDAEKLVKLVQHAIKIFK